LQDDENDATFGDEIYQRIDALKQRRRNDKINQILSAAAEGDLLAMKAALKVKNAGVVSTCISPGTDEAFIVC
jgi:hypothetical protein